MARRTFAGTESTWIVDAAFSPGFHLLLGGNAQGKTNLLEAIYLMATLRSFRGVGGAQMIRHGQTGYFVGGKVVGQEEHEIKMYWSVRERKLSLDGQSVRRLSDYFGVLRTVVLMWRLRLAYFFGAKPEKLARWYNAS